MALLDAGEAVRFPTDRPHGYRNLGVAPAIFHNLIHYPASRACPRVSLDAHQLGAGQYGSIDPDKQTIRQAPGQAAQVPAVQGIGRPKQRIRTLIRAAMITSANAHWILRPTCKARPL